MRTRSRHTACPVQQAISTSGFVRRQTTLRALAAFGAPLSDLSVEDLTEPDTVFQMGLPPARIDILSGITGVGFAEAWERRVTVRLGQNEVGVLSKVDFIANKTAVGRPKDLADMALLDEADGLDR